MNHHLSPGELDRRAFLKTSSLGTAAVLAAPWLARAAGANERLRIGMIGTGGRGTDLMNQLLGLTSSHNVEIVALCDVWQKNLAAGAARVKQKQAAGPKTFTRFEELLALKGVDAVTIATPDFSHGPILVAALKAGKDVYIEKPMTIDLAFANQALDLALSGQRIVQAGTQRRSEGKFIGAAKFVATGALGTFSRFNVTVGFNHARWIRKVDDCVAADVDWEAFLLQLPRRPFDAKLLRQWQLYRATSNGMAGLWMTHYADVVSFVTGAKYPASAVAHGGIYVWKDGREHTDTFHALVDYPEGFLFSWGMGLGNGNGIQTTAHGTKGTLDLEKFIFTPEGNRAAPQALAAETDRSHMGNWIECIRSREQPVCNIQCGHQHAVTTILCAQALENGRRMKYDPAQRAIVPG